MFGRARCPTNQCIWAKFHHVRRLRTALAVGFGSLIGCGLGCNESPTASSLADSAQPAPAPRPAPRPKIVCRAPDCAVIDDDGVGAVRLDAPLRSSLVGDDADRRYVTRLIADGQPMAGFQLDDPPVLAVVGEGDPDGTRRPEAVRQAVQQLRGGKLSVRAIHVTDPSPRTARGVGVGSTLDELTRAHGEVRLHGVPVTYGDDRCVATVRALERVRFHFSSCTAARQGAAVVRVLIFPPD